MFTKVLVANRGEIAMRIIRALREMGITSVALFSDPDREALHTRFADEAVHIGGAASSESYLVMERVIEAAKQTGAQAIHPGYGFLSENAEFARLCEQNDITFIGPSADCIASMGSKTAARTIMAKAGVNLVPGTTEALQSAEEARPIAVKMGYPVTLKAAAGGGGKGMRRVDRPEDLERAFAAAKSESLASFGDDTIYIEKFIVNPRHVEIQVLGDKHGHLIHLGERDCSVQRRHQKVIEESPCPVMTPELREAMGAAALQAAKAVNYYSAGTVEFLLDPEGTFYFMEMNTRLQVEHPVTEMVTGVDLVKAMVRIAEGEPLALKQEDVRVRGHAIQCRIYAEDPYNNFMPSPGTIKGLRVPGGAGVRDDSAVYEGCEISLHYDPLISKLIAYGSNRKQALDAMGRALLEYQILGMTTNLDFHRRVVEDPVFISGKYHTGYIQEAFERGLMTHKGDHEQQALIAALVHRYLNDKKTKPFSGKDAPLSAWGKRARLTNLRKS